MPKQRSVYLGQYTDMVANEIAGALHEAGIPWHYKQSGAVGKALFIGEWGTRLYVEASRLEEAREIAGRVEPEARARLNAARGSSKAVPKRSWRRRRRD